MTSSVRDKTEPDIRTASFDAIFRAAAVRVLRRRGVPEHAIEQEITRIRQIEPSFRLPTPEELTDGEQRGEPS